MIIFLPCFFEVSFIVGHITILDFIMLHTLTNLSWGRNNIKTLDKDFLLCDCSYSSLYFRQQVYQMRTSQPVLVYRQEN